MRVTKKNERIKLHIHMRNRINFKLIFKKKKKNTLNKVEYEHT